jgi:thiol-disulfide isomerase/thioredoxin
MKENSTTSGRCAAFIGKLALTALLLVSGWRARAQDGAAMATNNPEADKAWREVYKASQPPGPSPEWTTNRPSREELAKYYAPALLKGADVARDFYTKYPNHPKAAEAQKTEYRLLTIAANQFGETSQNARMAALEAERMKDPKLSDDERFHLRQGALQRLQAGLPGTKEEYLKELAALQKDFPKKEEVYSLMLMAASQMEGDESQALLKAIMDGPAPEDMKARAKGMLGKMDAVGKPLAIKYAALDGREVSIEAFKGKVVLIDFWATWCGPCVGELPNVKAAYEKLHGQGFEIVGISFDEDKAALEKFVKEKDMAWPQYFDGKGWSNAFGQQFGINSIPTMWLVDKQGILRDINARDGLMERVEKMLSEK